MHKEHVIKILSLIVILFFISCEDFEDNRRVLIKGKISNIDQLNQQDIPIEISFGERNDQFQPNQNIIGRTIVQPNGEFLATIPVPINEEVNVVPIQNIDADFSIIQNILIPNEVFDRNTDSNLIDFGEFEILENASLSINFIKTSTGPSTINWQLNSILYQCLFAYDVENAALSTNILCVNPLNQGDSFTDIDQTLTFNFVRNSTISINFTINDGQSQSLDVVLTQANNEINIFY